jgi:hypothetical protein
MPAIATEMFFIILLTFFLPQHVLVRTGHPQLERNINYLSMVLSMPQRIRCFVIV